MTFGCRVTSREAKVTALQREMSGFSGMPGTVGLRPRHIGEPVDAPQVLGAEWAYKKIPMPYRIRRRGTLYGSRACGRAVCETPWGAIENNTWGNTWGVAEDDHGNVFKVSVYN